MKQRFEIVFRLEIENPVELTTIDIRYATGPVPHVRDAVDDNLSDAIWSTFDKAEGRVYLERVDRIVIDEPAKTKVDGRTNEEKARDGYERYMMSELQREDILAIWTAKVAVIESDPKAWVNSYLHEFAIGVLEGPKK